MKFLIVSLTVLILSFSASAQRPRRMAAGSEETMDAPPRQGFLSPEFEPHSAPMRWLEQLSRENPAEHERLQKLRRENPRAFHRELHRTLKQQHGMAGLRRYPRVMQAVQEMPEDERDEFMRCFSLQFVPAPEQEPPRRRRWGAPFPPGPEGYPPEPEYDRIQNELNLLTRAWRDEKDTGAQRQIEDRMRVCLAQLFDLRDQARIRHIEQIEQDLERLKSNLAERQSLREELIEQQLRETTGHADIEEK